MSTKLGRRLAYLLRHRPDEIGLHPDPAGWVAIRDLLEGLRASGRSVTENDLHSTIIQDPKARFTVDPSGTRIRAAQGHSFEVDLGLEARTPPPLLFHGTASHHLDDILREGLKPGARRQVHLSADREVALTVGRRHGNPVVLAIDCESASAAGLAFHQADNGVWLTDAVPASFVRKDEPSPAPPPPGTCRP